MKTLATWQLRHILRDLEYIADSMEHDDCVYLLTDALFKLGETLGYINCNTSYFDEDQRKWAKSIFKMEREIEDMLFNLTL